MALSKGSTVEIKGTLLSGVVEGKKLANDDETMLYLVKYSDTNGRQERYFEEDALRETKSASPAVAAKGETK